MKSIFRSKQSYGPSNSTKTLIKSRRTVLKSSKSLAPVKRTTKGMRSIMTPGNSPIELYKAKDDRLIPDLTKKYGKPVDQYFDKKGKPVLVFKNKQDTDILVRLRNQYDGIEVFNTETQMVDYKYDKPFPNKTKDSKKTTQELIENYGNASNIAINWVRHGVSCANITELYMKAFTRSGDTPLFESATLGACYLNKFNRGTGENLPYAYDADFVFCSQMIRAIQTAILMFPDKFLEGKIRVVTGINEFGISSGNRPQKWQNTLKDLKAWYKLTRKNLDRLYTNPGFCEEAFTLFDQNFDECADNLFILFRKNLVEKYSSKSMPEDTVVPDIVDYLYYPEVYRNVNGEMNKGFGFKNGNTSYFEIPKNITIVSHSNYIKKNIMDKEFLNKLKKTKNMPSKKDGKLYNNGIYVKYYRVRSFYSETQRVILKKGRIENKNISQRIVAQGCLTNDKTKKLNCFKSLQEYDKADSNDNFGLAMSMPLEFTTNVCRKSNKGYTNSLSPKRLVTKLGKKKSKKKKSKSKSS